MSPTCKTLRRASDALLVLTNWSIYKKGGLANSEHLKGKYIDNMLSGTDGRTLHY